MSIASVVTGGFGSFGSIGLVVTFGYGIGTPPIPPPPAPTVTIQRTFPTFNTGVASGPVYDGRLDRDLMLAALQQQDEEFLLLIAMIMNTEHHLSIVEEWQ
jgi:hypothetical protein